MLCKMEDRYLVTPTTPQFDPDSPSIVPLLVHLVYILHMVPAWLVNGADSPTDASNRYFAQSYCTHSTHDIMTVSSHIELQRWRLTPLQTPVL